MTFWVSFATEKDNLGVVIIDARDPEHALIKIKKACLYPGGEALFIEMPRNNPAAVAEVNLWGKDRLISIEELKARDYKKRSELSESERMKLDTDPTLVRICEECAE